ncbi:hypothetical protein D3C76_1234480 [compost metagenome]
MGLQWTQVRELGRIEVGFVGNFREQVKEAIDRRQKRRVIAQLAPEFMPHSSPQMNIRNRYNVDNGNDDFHGIVTRQR